MEEFVCASNVLESGHDLVLDCSRFPVMLALSLYICKVSIFFRCRLHMLCALVQVSLVTVLCDTIMKLSRFIVLDCINPKMFFV